jgi:hypothetical protein
MKWRNLMSVRIKGGENNMKKALKIGGRTISVWLLIAIVVAAVVASASVIIATIQIGYKITPSGGSAPTMTPSTLNLNLGTIPSGSSGTKDFGKVATLNLPVGYEITFTFDLSTTEDFSTFDVHIYIYKTGETMYTYYLYLFKSDIFNRASVVMDAGTYDVQVKITYTAASATAEKTGNVKINVSYPG